MQTTPFNEAEIADAKAAFAEAFNAERLRSPFGEPDPFRAALTIWNEDNGQLPRALWVAHAAKWHKDPEVIAIVEEAKEEERQRREAIEEEKIPLTPEEVRKHVLKIGYQISSNPLVEPRDRIAPLDRMSKAAGSDAKPNDDDNAGKILGVIQHRLAPMNPTEFAEFAFQQQSELQGDLVELAASDVRVIN